MKKRLIIWGLVALLIGSFFGFGSVGAENRIWIERAFRLTTTILNTAHTWVSSQTFTTVDINGGTIDGTTVGATTPAAGAFTTVKATTGATNGLILVSDASGNLSYGDPATYANAGLNSLVNPRGMAQGINMTAAASGSNGIQVADNANLDNDAGNFGYNIGVLLPDYTPAANVILAQKSDATNGWILSGVTTGYLRLTLNDTALDSTATLASVGVTDGYAVDIGFSVTRAAALDTVQFFVNGPQLGTDVTSAAEAGVTTTNAVSLYTMGTSAVRSAGRVYYSIPYNRARTAAEHLAFYKNGVDFADKWGSQTAEYITNQVDRDFSGANNWTNTNINSFDSAGDLSLTATAGGQYCQLTTGFTTLTAGYTYRISMDVANLVGTWGVYNQATTTLYGTVTANGRTTFYFTAGTTDGICVIANQTNSSGDFDNFTIIRTGATLNLQPEGIQPAPGQWLDSSTNKLHAIQPATGSSLIRPKRDFEINWANTWSGTTETQYVGGINQAILTGSPATGVTPYITEMWGVISGTTIEDVIYGDGSDTDRWVAITTGLASGITKFTVVNPTPDGTNYKMTIAPDAAFTGSIRTTVKGVILQ